jgi:hypothetical protein
MDFPETLFERNVIGHSILCHQMSYYQLRYHEGCANFKRGDDTSAI